MNEQIWDLLKQSGIDIDEDQESNIEKFAELVIEDYVKKVVISNMSDSAYAKAMDAYYEKKWAHRFD